MMGKGKGPKASSACVKTRSLLPTFPRGDASKEARHKVRKH